MKPQDTNPSVAAVSGELDAGAPACEQISIVVGDKRLTWPREAFERGASRVWDSEGSYMEAESYALSVKAVLEALKEAGIETIRL